jgi:hypothetical protein
MSMVAIRIYKQQIFEVGSVPQLPVTHWRRALAPGVQTFCMCEQASKELTALSVPRLPASFASVPEDSVASSPRRSRSTVLQRLPSLQGKEYTPEV